MFGICFIVNYNVSIDQLVGITKSNMLNSDKLLHVSGYWYYTSPFADSYGGDYWTTTIRTSATFPAQFLSFGSKDLKWSVWDSSGAGISIVGIRPLKF